MWSHKYNAKCLIQNYSDNINKLLGIQNLLIYGPRGSGVFDAVNYALESHDLIKKHDWNYTDCRLSNDNKNTLRLLNRQNKQCFELVMKDYGTNERYVIKNVLQELSNTYIIEGDSLGLNYKVIVIYNIEWFSKESQQILGIFAEKCSNCSRYIFTTHQFSNVNPKLKSQCFIYRIPRPSTTILKTHLNYILESEKKTLDESVMCNIMDKCSNHIEECVNHVQLAVYDVQHSLDNVYNKIVDVLCSKKVNKIKHIRELVYILLVNNVDNSNIMISMIDKLPHYTQAVIEIAATYEPRLHMCERPMYHMEAFFMKLVKIMEH